MYGGNNYYTRLGLDHFATKSEIKQAYRRLAKKHHPDLNPNDPTAEEQFQKINEAYETLYDSSKRVKYDSGFEEAFKTTYARTARTTASHTTSTYSQTQSGYGYRDFGTTHTDFNFDEVSFSRKIANTIAFKELPNLHFLVLAGLAILLLIIPFDKSLSFSQHTGVSMRLTFFIIHLIFSTWWVDRSCHNLKDDFIVLPMMVFFTHGATAIGAVALTIALQASFYLFKLPQFIHSLWNSL